MTSEMTEQEKLTIRAELARRMGWQIAFLSNDPANAMALHRPDGSPVAQTVDKMSENVWQYAPDPSTNADDNHALVAWICRKDDDNGTNLQI